MNVLTTMWRYIDGVSKPEKRKRTEEEKREVQRVYDNEKRERSFQAEWQTQFKWLLFENSAMFCSVCRKFETNGSFVTGCKNFRVGTLKEHNCSKSHDENLKRHNAEQNPASSAAMKSVSMLNKAAFGRLCLLFRTAHFVAKTGRPYTDYAKLCELDKAKGLDPGNTYLSDKYCQKFVHAIADGCRIEQDKIISSGQFISIISDGSTDASSKEAEIVYIRSSVECKVYTHFIGICNVPRGDSENISRSIIKLLTERYSDEWISKIVAMGTDGASVMLGKKSGVVQKIREHTNRPFVYAIHCSAHRLELAYRDCLKKVKLHEKCEALLLNLYLFYKYSPLNRSNLNTSFSSLGLKMRVPTRVGGTRWLPHTKRAIQHVLLGYDAIVQHLEQLQSPSDPASKKDSAAKARNFLKALKDHNVVFWLHFMMDVVCCLSTLSEAIQEANATLADVWNELESAVSTLEKYKSSCGPYLKKIQDSDTDHSTLESTRQNFLSSIITAIPSRFEGDLHLFKGSDFLNFQKWPEDYAEAEFYDKAVTDLVEQCRQALEAGSVSVEDIEPEWSRFKRELYNSKRKIRSLSWVSVYQCVGSKYPSLMSFINFLLTLPSSSVDAERGFSRMKIVKSDWRSRLGDKNLSDLLLVAAESPSVQDYIPDRDVNYWTADGLRSKRPFYRENKKVKQSVETENIQDDDDTVDVFQMAEILDPDPSPVSPTASDDEATSDDDEHYRDIQLLQNKAYKLFMSYL